MMVITVVALTFLAIDSWLFWHSGSSTLKLPDLAPIVAEQPSRLQHRMRYASVSGTCGLSKRLPSKMVAAWHPTDSACIDSFKPSANQMLVGPPEDC
jgi:hypothetical protein